MNRIDILMPRLGANDNTVKLCLWCVASGDYISKGQVIAIVETTKETKEIIAPGDGYIFLCVNEYDDVEVGFCVAYLSDNADGLASEEETDCFPKKNNPDPVIISNITKKALALAEKEGLDLASLPKEKMLREKDILEIINKKKASVPKGAIFNFDKERVVIIGAGNGAEVVIDILMDDYDKKIVGIVDDNRNVTRNFGYQILPCNINEFIETYDKSAYDTVIISIGADLKSMKIRREIFEKAKAAGIVFTNVIAKSAEIRRSVMIGEGNLIGAGVYIGTKTIIGNNNSISYRATIGHHNAIGDHNLIAPNVVTSGSVSIGNNVILPACVALKNRVSIGDNVTLPLGYMVVSNIDTDTVIKEKF